jgi:hypothetical protein
MDTFRADPIIRLLTVIASILYRATGVLGVLLIVAVAALELLAGPETLQKFSIGVPANVELETETVGAAWGGSLHLRMDEAEGSLRVPIASAPGWFRLAAYSGLAVLYVLFLRFFFHLRELFLRVRGGAPFDRRNAASLRRLGLLMIATNILSSAYGSGLSRMVLRALSEPSMPLSASFSVNGAVILVGLVLLALAEIFRRGAILEDEQAHVV